MLSQAQKSSLKKEYASLIEKEELSRGQTMSLNQSEKQMVADEMVKALDIVIGEVQSSVAAGLRWPPDKP